MSAESDAVVPQEIVEEEPTAAVPEEILEEPIADEPEKRKQHPATFWDRLRQMLFGGANRAERLQQLSDAIADVPDAAVNYLLRGELYVEMNKTTLAIADFEQAAALAQEEYETERWGIAAQAIQDRALSNLERLEE